jgi:hypothetical protein
MKTFGQKFNLTKTMPTIENFGKKIRFAQLCFRPKQRQPFKNFWPKNVIRQTVVFGQTNASPIPQHLLLKKNSRKVIPTDHNNPQKLWMKFIK